MPRLDKFYLLSLFFIYLLGLTNDYGLQRNIFILVLKSKNGNIPQLCSSIPTPTPTPTLDPSLTPTLDPSLTPTLDPSLTPTLDPSLASNFILYCPTPIYILLLLFYIYSYSYSIYSYSYPHIQVPLCSLFTFLRTTLHSVSVPLNRKFGSLLRIYICMRKFRILFIIFIN